MTTIRARLAAIRARNHDGRIKHVKTMIAHGCYPAPYIPRIYRYDYERQEAKRIGVWADVALWIRSGNRPIPADYCMGDAMTAAYCRVRALMMLGMSLRHAIRDAQRQTTPVVLYPYIGGGYCYEGQNAYTPDSFGRRVMPYLDRGDNWDMFVALRLLPGGRPQVSIDDGCCCIVSLDSSIGMCEYGRVSVMHDRQQCVELCAVGGAKVWEAFLSGGFAAGMRAAME